MRSTVYMLAASFILSGLTTWTLHGQGGVSIDKSYAGTWKVNLAKSTYEPGPAPKESTRVHEDRGNGFWLITTDGVNAQGQRGHGSYVYKPDGKQYPVAGRNQSTVNTIALTIVDPYTVEFTNYADGKAVGTGRRTVARDGKTMIIESKGSNAQGQSTSSHVVWEKQ
jgi:hypothetical protein